MLGSLPGEASLAAGRYYAHPQNAFWRLIGGVIDEDIAALPYDDRLATLLRHRVGLWDVVGEATLQQAGNSLFLDYVLRLAYNGSEVDVRVDDRMYLVAPDVLINESSLSKFGVRVGNLVLVITRKPDSV